MNSRRIIPPIGTPVIRFHCFAALVLALLLAACAGPVGWVRIQPPENLLAEDGDPKSRLLGAIDQSIAYYERLPPDHYFTFQSLRYSPAEMAASLVLFRKIYQDSPDEKTFEKELLQRFYLIDSVAGQGVNLFTAYYEPRFPGARQATPALNAPVLTRPPDLVEIALRDFSDNLPKANLKGRLEGGRMVPYPSRREIQEAEVLKGRVDVLAYMNEIDLFFLQIQGSGQIRFPNGEILKVGYAGSNGHPYRSIGAELIKREKMVLEKVSMQSIRRYLMEHPQELRSILFSNPSYVFFRPVPGGPVGNLGVPLTPGRSLAVDFNLFPKGALAFVSLSLPNAADPTRTGIFRRFMVLQDTGGAIRGHGRADIFLGAGTDAEVVAGHTRHPGRLILLMAKKSALTSASGGQ